MVQGSFEGVFSVFLVAYCQIVRLPDLQQNNLIYFLLKLSGRTGWIEDILLTKMQKLDQDTKRFLLLAQINS